MAASGFAGLGYQVVWTQQCALWLGHEAAAVLAVVTAFFGGLAVGALALGTRIERSREARCWYAGCELLIAAWGLLLIKTMPLLSNWLLAITGAAPTPLWQWSVAFGGTFLMLLPATVAMGATLPAMERITVAALVSWRSLAPLYASNTVGAVLGVLATAFWLLPAYGLTHTAGVCVALNLLCAITALALFPRHVEIARSPSTAPAAAHSSAALARLACTGLLGIGYEVLVVRVLSQVAENTVYTFALLLAVYLIGTALGAAVYRLLDHSAPRQLNDRLLSALSMSCLIGTACLFAAEFVRAQALHVFGASMTAALAAEALLAVLAFGPATVVMGALFSHQSAWANASGVCFGRALGVNTAGAAAAPLLFGVLGFPALGAKFALLAVAVGYLILISRAAWLTPHVWLPAALVAALAFGAPPLAFIEVPAGGHVVSYQEGVMAAVSVVEDSEGVARLRIDNRQQEGSSASLRVDARQALLPILLHPAPRHALFLGLGTGVTAAAAAEDQDLQVDVVELLPEVIEASRHFTAAFDHGVPNPRLRLITADARRYVRSSAQTYDVIVSDNFHPARSGSGSLYTVEHFDAVRGRLAAGGLFCQWLPLHQLDLETLRSIVQSFLASFPGARAILASNSLETPVIGLIGRVGPGGFDVEQLRARLREAALPISPAEFGIEDEFALLGSFFAGPESLARFAGQVPANTDDHPLVAYRAPRITYAPDSQPRDRLLALLAEVEVAPLEVIAQSADETLPHRLAAYWQARNRFVQAGRAVKPSADVRAMLAQVREPLMSVLRVSPDFRPAYDPLLQMAAALAQTDGSAARALLGELSAVQPARGEAAALLHELEQATP